MKYLLLTLFLFSLLTAYSQKNKITGIVTDSKNNPLPSAMVEVGETHKRTLTDEQGRFYLVIEPTDKTLKVGYIGYQPKTMEIGTGKAVLTIRLEENTTRLSEVKVYGKITRGQAKALNAQKNATNITNVVDAELFSRYPDITAAEVVQRLPGISIVRDQGEGEFVQIRGIPEQYNSLTINGQRMPSVEPDAGRAVGLDLVQSSLIQKITVNKALTADMDGDAIGGMVNFELKKASKPMEVELFAGYGYNQQESELKTYGKSIKTFSALLGKRLAKNKLGLLITGNYFKTDKGSMFLAQAFKDRATDTLHTKRATDYDVRRERYGLVGNFDFQPNLNNTWNLTLNYNRYKDFEIRRQANYTLNNSKEERRTRNRLEDQEVKFAMFKGEHKLGTTSADYSASFSEGMEELPDRIEYRYSRTNNNLKSLTKDEINKLSVNTTFGNTTPIKYARAAILPRITNEKNTTFAANFKVPILKNKSSSFKFGVKYRILNRSALDGSLNLKTKAGTTIPNVAEGSAAYEGIRFTSAGYPNLGFTPLPGEVNFDSIYMGYNATEKVFAAYLLNEHTWSPTLSSSIGLRLENTFTDYQDKNTPGTGSGKYTNLLPSAHFTYKLSSQGQLRVAYSSGLSRPDYAILNPFETISTDEIRRGNESLKAIAVNNFDLMYELYTGKLSFFSAGIFGKLLKNQIYTKQVGTKDGLPIFIPVNGEKASLFGIELAVNQNLNEVKIPIIINANYTFTSSKAKYDATHTDLPLANSPRHIANLSFIFEKPNSRFSAVISGVYRHFVFNKFEDIDATGPGSEAIWLDKNFHVDFSTSYNFYKNFTFKLQLNNLTNQANIEVGGKPSEKISRWTERESYGISGLAILEWKL